MRYFVLFLASVTLAADWPRFRGPNGSGIADATPTKWTATENRLWTYDIPGTGNGSPIIAKGKLFVQCAAKDGSSRSLICLDAATGKELWVKKHSGQMGKTHQKNSLASSTPACDGERVYVCFWDGRGVALVAYTMDGKELWSEKLGNYVSQHGAGMSPMVHAGKVFVNFDQDGEAELVAYDAVTGKRAWAQKRKAYRACYSTPIVRDLPNGGSEIVDLSTAGLTAYDPATGTVNWDSPFSWNGTMALRSVASPVIVGDIIIALTGDGGGSRYCCGIKPGPTPTVVWQIKASKNTPYVPCPVASGKHLFWLTDQGKIECINPLNGKAVWSDEAFSSSVSASPILVGDTLMLIDERGKAIACKADATGYTTLSTSNVGEAVFATPAAADGRLYIRGASSLICIGAK